jgi:hypothetical protein
MKYIFVCAFCVLVLGACQVYMLSESASGSCLLDTEMFSHDWAWDKVVVSENNKEVVDGNQVGAIIDTVVMSGLYDSLYKFSVSNSVYEYPSNITRDFELNYSPPARSDIEEFNPSFIRIGNQMDYGCVIERNDDPNSLFDCKILAVYKNHASIIYVMGPASLTSEKVESIINPLLASIDSCMESLKK